MRYFSILLFTTFLFSSEVASGQYYETGQDPSSIKWMQIKTGRFTVIYPEKYGAGGITYAKSLDEAYSKLTSLYPEKKFKIPVVIHSFTIESNGYVAWAPRRMEIYPTPEQNTIPLDPDKQLAIHELTHVLQMESLNRGFSKGMSLALGEQFTGIVASLLPLWFLEGDAVFAESALTESGRGRSASFQKQLKAISVEKGKMYNYDMIVNGSYKHFIPDHYESGYQIVTWALAKHDPQIWNKVLQFTGDQPFTISPVNISLSKISGLTKRKLFNETFDTLKTIWTKDVTENKALVYETINPDKRGKYINYYSPVYAGTDSIIALKSSLSEPSAFVLINPAEKTEKKLHTPGQVYPWFFSFGSGKIVWVETQPDPRWENRDYSVIKLMDLRNSKVIRLSRKSRYMAASISSDGKKIAAVENSVDNQNSIDIIDAMNGNILQSVASPENIYLEHPQWGEKGEVITFISLTGAGEGIISYSPGSQKWRTLVEPGRNDLQSSFLRNDSLFFTSSFSGTENIYLRTPDNRTKELTFSRFGAIDLNISGGNLLFSDYSSLGNNISTIPLNTAYVSNSDYVSSASYLINRFDIKPQAPDNSPVSAYTPVPYRKWQHLFNFHSWMPFYADIEEIKSDPASIRPGLSLMTQNHLSTLISSIGYEYSAEKNHVFHSRIKWNGWYPVIESQLDYGNDPVVYKVGENIGDPSELQTGIKFSNSVSLPLHFSSGRFSQYFRPSIVSDYRNKYIYIKEEGTYDYGQTIISGRLYFSNYYRSALRDIYPRWAQTIDLNYSNAPFDKNIYGSAITLKTAWYFPGLLPNNSIKIRVEREKQYPELYLFSNRASFPRGYKNILSKDISLLSGDYVLPLVYPDFNISSLLYMKRIRTSLFYDYASGKGNYYYTNIGLGTDSYHNYRETFRSFGLELMSDFHLLRIPYEISAGVQTAWKNINQKPTFEFLLNIDLFGMSIGKNQM